nr:GH3 auxin-responsive promoter family protein [Bacteroidia bacterium]
MSLLSALSRPLAALVAAQTRNWSRHPRRAQQRIFDELVRNGRMTAFGQDHAFDTIRTYAHFSKQVPVRDYEALRPWLDRVKAAEDHVLWPGKPLYLAKTSGTTSGAKYIPITRASIPNHIESTRNALLNYIHRTGKARFLDGKLIFISGSPALDTTNGILTGRLSGIVNHHVPAYLRRNQLPSYATNTIEDWEVKVDAIVEETLRADMRFISGIPPWVQMYFDRLTTRTGKPIKDIFPNFELFVYGGVNYEPYRAKIEQSIGRPVDSIELYPASEGFIAYQDIPGDPGMLLMLNSGIFYEFIPLAEYFSPNPTRLPIWEVQPGVNYAIVLNTNAGLWGYSLGDTVRFVSTDPYRLVVTGRVKHF